MGSSFSSNELADENDVFIDKNSGDIMLSTLLYPDAANNNSNMAASAPASQDAIQEHNMPTVPSEGLGDPADEFDYFEQNAVSPQHVSQNIPIDEMSGDGEMVEVEPFDRPEDIHSEPDLLDLDEYGKGRKQNNMASSSSPQTMNANAGHHPQINSYAGLVNPTPAPDEQKNHSEEAIKRDQLTRQQQKKNSRIAKAPSKAKMNKKYGSRKSTDVETILDACEKAIQNCEPKKISPSERRARGTLTPEEKEQNRVDINMRSRERQKGHLLDLENLIRKKEMEFNDILQKYNNNVEMNRNLKENGHLKSADTFIRDDPIPTNPMTNDFNEDSRGNNKVLDVLDAGQKNGELIENSNNNQDEAAGTSGTNTDGKKRRKWSGSDKERRRQSNREAQQKQRDKKKQIIEKLKNEIRKIWKRIDYYTNLIKSLEDLYDGKDVMMHSTTSQMDRHNVDASQAVHDPW